MSTAQAKKGNVVANQMTTAAAARIQSRADSTGNPSLQGFKARAMSAAAKNTKK
ncbi:MAG: hypothetical protein ABSB29_06455 [Nitrososphaerales archaeon]